MSAEVGSADVDFLAVADSGRSETSGGRSVGTRVASCRDIRHRTRYSRLTHAGEDGAAEADLMNPSGHEDRHTLQCYLEPSKEGAHRRLDEIDATDPPGRPAQTNSPPASRTTD